MVGTGRKLERKLPYLLSSITPAWYHPYVQFEVTIDTHCSQTVDPLLSNSGKGGNAAAGKIPQWPPLKDHKLWICHATWWLYCNLQLPVCCEFRVVKCEVQNSDLRFIHKVICRVVGHGTAVTYLGIKWRRTSATVWSWLDIVSTSWRYRPRRSWLGSVYVPASSQTVDNNLSLFWIAHPIAPELQYDLNTQECTTRINLTTSLKTDVDNFRRHKELSIHQPNFILAAWKVWHCMDWRFCGVLSCCPCGEDR